MRRSCLILVLLVVLAGNCWALDVPKLEGRVNDYAKIFTPDQKAQLEAKLKAFEDATSNQIALLTIPSLAGEEDVAYGVKVFKAWQLGQKSNDNGVLWLHAIKERRNRLEVGYGLEGALPDAICKIILRQQVAPQFKAGNFFGGYIAGIDAIMAATKGEYQAEQAAAASSQGGKEYEGEGLKYLLFIFPLFFAVCGSLIHRAVGGIFGGLGSAIVAWLLIGPIAAIIFGFVGFLIGLIAKDILETLSDGDGTGSGGSGGYYSGGGSSGSFFSSSDSSSSSSDSSSSSSDSSSSSSGFSGGGGSSGGGGAGDSY